MMSSTTRLAVEMQQIAKTCYRVETAIEHAGQITMTLRASQIEFGFSILDRYNDRLNN